MIRWILVCMVAFFAAGAAWAQQAVGTITYKMLMSGEAPVVMTMKSDGKRSAMEVKTDDGPVTVVYDSDYIVMIVHSEKTAMKVKAAMGQQMAESFMPGAPDIPTPGDKESGSAADVSWKRTGKKESIAGITCEQWMIKSSEGSMEYWVPTSPGAVPAVPGMIASMAIAMQNGNSGLPASMPLRIVWSGDGQRGSMEATYVSSSAPPSSAFSIPAGYQVTDMTKMLQE